MGLNRHADYIDALAPRHYDASVGGAQLIRDFAHGANFNHTAVFDTSKNVIERYSYYAAYGDPGVLGANYAADSDGLNDIANGTTYTGRSLDTETGLSYYRSFLWPQSFIERDKPVGVWCAPPPASLLVRSEWSSARWRAKARHAVGIVEQ